MERLERGGWPAGRLAGSGAGVVGNDRVFAEGALQGLQSVAECGGVRAEIRAAQPAAGRPAR